MRKVGKVLSTILTVLGSITIIYVILITIAAKSYGDLPARDDDDIAY